MKGSQLRNRFTEKNKSPAGQEIQKQHKDKHEKLNMRRQNRNAAEQKKPEALRPQKVNNTAGVAAATANIEQRGQEGTAKRGGQHSLGNTNA